MVDLINFLSVFGKESLGLGVLALDSALNELLLVSDLLNMLETSTLDVLRRVNGLIYCVLI